MPTWHDILTELQTEVSSMDAVRRKYLCQLHELTGRNIIVYYSGWLQREFRRGMDINDLDINDLMAAIHKLDCSLGLDLILHTPGGEISSTEQIVYYLKSKFGNDIRAFVPQIAMSAGTMIACACKEIFMGNQSSLGPIDPQLGGVSARGVFEEFEKALAAIKEDPASIPLWQVIIGKYHPTFIDTCIKAWNRSQTIVSNWLADNMLADAPDVIDKSSKIVSDLSELGHNLGHDKHISLDEAIKTGLKIKRLEDDQKLQDAILTVHHCMNHCFSQNVSLTKAIENHLGVGVFQYSQPGH